MDNKYLLSQESPMKQCYDNFDVSEIGLSPEQYKIMAMKTPIQQTTNLLLTDWKRRVYFQNIIASITGISGSGKSSFISSCALTLGKISKESMHYDYDPFTVENVYYEPAEIRDRIPTLKEGEILLRDEHLHGQAGIGSDLTTAVLKDAEQQLRKRKNSFFFASIEQEDHSTFFNFSTKHIISDQTGYPRFVIAMLSTPLYSNENIFVWRGLVSMPFPSKEYWVAYEKRKDDHIALLVKQYGNNYSSASIDAINIVKKFHDELIFRTREGLVKPIKTDSVERIVYDEIGTRKYTNKIYSMLISEIQERLIKEYKEQNDAKLIEIEARKEKAVLEKKEILQMQIDEARRIKEAKMLAFQEKLAEDRRRNDLKEQALKIRENELLIARAKKEQKEKMRSDGSIDHFKEGFV